jgi:hypothetical protein
MIETAHIHTDLKFIQLSSNFSGDVFNNHLIGISSTEISIDHDVVYYNAMDSKTEFNSMIKFLQKMELVVIYGLSEIMVKIIQLIPSEIKIAWRFFGYELYKLLPAYCYTPLTVEAGYLKTNMKLRNFLKSIKYNPVSILKKLLLKVNKDSDFKKSIKRIDYFICLCKEEYSFLAKNFSYMPRFIEAPVRKAPIHYERIESHKNHDLFGFGKKNDRQKIIVGHSRNAFNNHLDIINVLKRKTVINKYSFEFLFSYGSNGPYAEKVRCEVNNMTNAHLYEDFLSYENFAKFYNDAAAFVMNGHRQMAMGSIFMSLIKGVKIYLNPLNPVIEWLLSENFIINTISDFENDFNCVNFQLSLNDAIHNRNNFIKFQKKYTIHDFQIIMRDRVVNG